MANPSAFAWKEPATIQTPHRPGRRRLRDEHWEPYKEYILTLRSQGYTSDKIHQELVTRYEFTADKTSLKRRLREWQPKNKKRNCPSQKNTPEECVVQKHAEVEISSADNKRRRINPSVESTIQNEPEGPYGENTKHQAPKSIRENLTDSRDTAPRVNYPPPRAITCTGIEVLEMATRALYESTTDRFRCYMCPREFSRACDYYYHFKTHKDDRLSICTACGKPCSRPIDITLHYQNWHSATTLFQCRGKLANGDAWGCEHRFARADALGRHFRTEAGRECIKILLEEEYSRFIDIAERRERTNTQVNEFSDPLRVDMFLNLLKMIEEINDGGVKVHAPTAGLIRTIREALDTQCSDLGPDLTGEDHHSETQPFQGDKATPTPTPPVVNVKLGRVSTVGEPDLKKSESQQSQSVEGSPRRSAEDDRFSSESGNNIDREMEINARIHSVVRRTRDRSEISERLDTPKATDPSRLACGRSLPTLPHPSMIALDHLDGANSPKLSEGVISTPTVPDRSAATEPALDEIDIWFPGHTKTEMTWTEKTSDLISWNEFVGCLDSEGYLGRILDFDSRLSFPGIEDRIRTKAKAPTPKQWRLPACDANGAITCLSRGSGPPKRDLSKSFGEHESETHQTSNIRSGGHRFSNLEA